MEVVIYKKENVKPSTPTHESLRIYQYSLLDQIFGVLYMPVVFFYPGGGSHHDYDKLRESLARALSVWYPLAGRTRGDGSSVVECNDEGADFVRANVRNFGLAEFLRRPEQPLLRQLFPRNPYPVAFDPTQPMLAVQVNRFKCGGTAVAICLWHGLADGAALSGFLQTWAEINRDQRSPTAVPPHSVVADAAAVFPPAKIDVTKLLFSTVAQRNKARVRCIGKRFIFPKHEIEKLKDKYSDGRRRPTRVEALSAFIWAAVIRATLKANCNFKAHFLLNTVDLRRRMNPPFHPTCLGNIFLSSAARWENNAAAAAAISGGDKSLVGKIREAIGKVTDDYVREMFEGGGYLKTLVDERGGDDNQFFSISTWFKFECLKVDLGWGKPIWLGPGNNLDDLALLLDDVDGGIEAWIGLQPQVMCHLEKDHEFLAHVSLSQVVSGSDLLMTTSRL
ncbi:unnamed protein product [Cuscuta campestris]|uniref:Uncharacterized protein n=1 Tax=Cuscuta campestris TaxID=132261 RepID=A0A484N3C8_9ASTE|nr:unnamed protein product [Cuscuta campestris]